MIARAENRGLGIQTWEFFRHMRPAKTLVVTLGDLARGFAEHLDRYVPNVDQDVSVTEWTGGEIEDAAIDWLLEGVDVLYTAETPYDFRILERARARGVASIVQPNFEFCRWAQEPDLVRPDLFLLPTTWHAEKIPGPRVVLPFPVDRERCTFRLRERAGTFLHVGGHRAHLDRNGTRLVVQASRYLRSDARIVIRTQDRIGWVRGLEMIHEDVPDYWRLYDVGDVLLAPRRYGGQSLPMNEAQSCGLPVLTLDMEPQREWLPKVSLVPVRRCRQIPTQGGPVAFAEPDPRRLARAIDYLATNDAEVKRLSLIANNYAATISWERLGPRYWETFAGVLDGKGQVEAVATGAG